MSDITQLLSQLESSDPKAAEELLPIVYEELRRVAAVKMAREPGNQTLQATALVHEAWLKLTNESQSAWRNRQHFFAMAAEVMRRILVDRARKRLTKKQGGDLERVDLEGIEVPMKVDDEIVIKVHDSLEQLHREDPAKAQVVKLKFFVGLTNAEIATLLDLNEKTVRRHWSFAKAWLFRDLATE
jgi:RNA polymerase sigma factor (TIGR02999 family)